MTALSSTKQWTATFSKIISVIFHPLFIPTYFFIYLLKFYAYEFAGMNSIVSVQRTVGVFVTTAFLPAFTVFLLWRLQFIQNIYIRTQKERIIPYVAIMFFYWWMFYLSRNFTDQPIILKPFFLGTFICSAVGLILNNFFKISMHGMAMGVWVIASIASNFILNGWVVGPMMLVIIIAGMVCSARLLLNEHKPFELYTGLIIGMLCEGFALYSSL